MTETVSAARRACVPGANFAPMPANRGKRERRTEGRAVSEERRRSERRLDDRVPVSIWVEEEHGRERCLRRTADLSQGGMQLDLGLPRPVGSRMHLRFTLPGETHVFELVAEVVSASWRDDRPITNVRFLDVSGDEHIQLTRFLEERLENH